MTLYGVIVCDYPWEYRNGGNGAAKNHYDTMTIAQGLRLDVQALAAPDGVLIMWATWPHLIDAHILIAAWDFEYITGFPWIKLQEPPLVDMFGNFVAHPSWGTGSWVRGCSEPILIAKRGAAKPPAQQWLGLMSKRMQHSRKPDSLHDYAESLPGPYLEMFARRRRAGWDAFGNQIKNSITIGVKPDASETKQDSTPAQPNDL